MNDENGKASHFNDSFDNSSSKKNIRQYKRKREDTASETGKAKSGSSREETKDQDEEPETEEIVVPERPPKKEGNPKNTKQWSSDEEIRLRKMMGKGDGKSWKDISIHFPCRSPDAIRNKWKKMNETETKNKNKPPKEKEMKEERKPSPPPPPKVLSPHISSRSQKDSETDDDRRRKLWTSEDDMKLTDLVLKHQPRSNEDWDDIANALGRTVKSVKHKFNDYRLYELLWDHQHAEDSDDK